MKATFGPPQWSRAPVKFELAEKTRAVANGGLAMMNQIAHPRRALDSRPDDGGRFLPTVLAGTNRHIAG